MKKIITIYCCCMGLHSMGQEAIFNNGSVLQINGNATLQVNGNMVNNAGSNYINEGMVKVLGNFTNNQYMAAPFNGTIFFDGNTAQTVNGSTALFAKNIVVNNATGINVLDTLKVDGVFSFINGIVAAADITNPVLFTSNGSTSNADVPTDASHVNGFVVRQGLGNFAYPIGDGIKYQQIAINTTTNSNGILVRYFPGDAGAAAFTNGGTETSALVSYNSKESWGIAPWNSGSGIGTVSIFWEGYKDAFDNPLHQRKVANRRLTDWVNQGTIATGSLSNGVVTSNELILLGAFTLGSITTPLPLQLISFSGNRSNSVNHLKWKLGNPTSLRLTVLEKSSNGTDFYAITSMQPNRNETYQFTDMVLQTGNSFYRLKLIDNNGKISLSNIIVLGSKAAMVSSVYPNPAKNNTTLRIGDSKLLNSKAILMDATGRTISTILISNYFETINMDNLPSGNYLLQLKNKEVLKINKQ